MGTNPPVGGFQVALKWQSSGDIEPMITTFGVFDNSPGRTLDGVADALVEAVSFSGIVGAATMSTGWTYVGLSVAETTAEGSNIADRPTSVPGVSSNVSCPSNCALLIRKLTGSGGRRNRGRMYVPAAYLHENSVDQNGNLTEILRSALQDNWTELLDQLALGNLPMVVYHSLPPLTGTIVSALNIQSKIATQRRRLR